MRVCLRSARPADKSLGDALARAPAEEIDQGDSGEAVSRDRNEEREHGMLEAA